MDMETYEESRIPAVSELKLINSYACRTARLQLCGKLTSPHQPLPNARSSQDDTWAKYLKEGLIVNVVTWDGKTISVDLPNTVELKVVECDPGVKGNTQSGAMHTQGKVRDCISQVIRELI
jgi:hypothetical protein